DGDGGGRAAGDVAAGRVSGAPQRAPAPQPADDAAQFGLLGGNGGRLAGGGPQGEFPVAGTVHGVRGAVAEDVDGVVGVPARPAGGAVGDEADPRPVHRVGEVGVG